MIDNALHLQELTQQLNQVLGLYFNQLHRDNCYVGLLFQQGKRKMIQINVPARDLHNLLQAKHAENNNPDSGKNRPEDKKHVKDVKEYLLKRTKRDKPWILGTLTANVNPDDITVIELVRGICIVSIPSVTKLDITDGQHRKRAIDELMDSLHSSLIADNDFPITLVLEGNFRQCQLDFKDMAQTKALSKTLLESFGESEGVTGIAKTITETVPMFADKTERVGTKGSSKKRLIYTLNYLKQMVSCAFADDAGNPLEDIDVDTSSKALETALNQFFAECDQTRHIFETPAENLTVEQVEKFMDHCVLGRSVGVELLGRLLYLTYNEDDNHFDRTQISQLAQLDWSCSGEIWQGNILMLDPNPQNPAKPYKFSKSVSAVKIALNQAKIHLGWLNSPLPSSLF